MINNDDGSSNDDGNGNTRASTDGIAAYTLQPQLPAAQLPSAQLPAARDQDPREGQPQPRDLRPPQSQSQLLLLNTWQGIALLTADCMGVGVLGLPNQVGLLGRAAGLSFLVLNCPINYYAGKLLAGLASDLESNHSKSKAGRSNSSSNSNSNSGNSSNNSNVIEVELAATGTTTTTTTATTDTKAATSTSSSSTTTTDRRSPSTSTRSSTPNTIGSRIRVRRRFSNRKKSYRGLPQHPQQQEEDDDHDNNNNDYDHDDYDFTEGAFQDETAMYDDDNDNDNDNDNDDDGQDTVTATAPSSGAAVRTYDNNRQTSDLVNITQAVFSPSSNNNDSNNINYNYYTLLLVKIVYLLNLFLVLGDYMLVMSRSVAAVVGEDNICLPRAGAIACVCMLAILCRFRTMAKLGRSVSLASLLALLVVLVQCLFHHRSRHRTNTNNTSDYDRDTYNYNDTYNDTYNYNDTATDSPETRTRNLLAAATATATTASRLAPLWGKFSSLAGIGFAVGSQKLFLNIRHELEDRHRAPRVLAGSLMGYGSVYVLVVLLAGPDPPSFLFDSIPTVGGGRSVAGVLLWFHVAVSYAINSQALCASLDHMLPPTNSASVAATSTATPTTTTSSTTTNTRRWFGITLAVCLSSYTVSNAIPFFKDLVALIGALTSVPLCLTLPAVLHRRYQHQHTQHHHHHRRRESICSKSSLLLVYSFVFLVIGLIGALSEIGEDWLTQGTPFACR